MPFPSPAMRPCRSTAAWRSPRARRCRAMRHRTGAGEAGGTRSRSGPGLRGTPGPRRSAPARCRGCRGWPGGTGAHKRARRRTRSLELRHDPWVRPGRAPSTAEGARCRAARRPCAAARASGATRGHASRAAPSRESPGSSCVGSLWRRGSVRAAPRPEQRRDQGAYAAHRAPRREAHLVALARDDRP